ncbi:MAG: hypothetical protein WC449_05370 [Candidatus Paceibacterota bacterium]
MYKQKLIDGINRLNSVGLGTGVEVFISKQKVLDLANQLPDAPDLKELEERVLALIHPGYIFGGLGERIREAFRNFTPASVSPYKIIIGGRTVGEIPIVDKATGRCSGDCPLFVDSVWDSSLDGCALRLGVMKEWIDKHDRYHKKERFLYPSPDCPRSHKPIHNSKPERRINRMEDLTPEMVVEVVNTNDNSIQEAMNIKLIDERGFYYVNNNIPRYKGYISIEEILGWKNYYLRMKEEK